MTARLSAVVVTNLLTSHTHIMAYSIGAMHLTRKRFWMVNVPGSNRVKFVLLTVGLEILALELRNTSGTTLAAFVSYRRQRYFIKVK